MPTPYPWAQKEAHYKTFNMDALLFSRDDAMKAAIAMRGWNPEKEGWYEDDMHTICAEINRRRKTAH